MSQRDPRMQKMIEQMYKDAASKKQQEMLTQQSIAQSRPALQAAPVSPPDASSASASLQQAMNGGSQVAGALKGINDMFSMYNQGNAEQARNQYLQQALMSKDPAALYMAGAGGYADALMKQDLQKEQMQQQMLGQQMANTMHAAGMDEAARQHDMMYGLQEQKMGEAARQHDMMYGLQEQMHGLQKQKFGFEQQQALRNALLEQAKQQQAIRKAEVDAQLDAQKEIEKEMSQISLKPEDRDLYMQNPALAKQYIKETSNFHFPFFGGNSRFKTEISEKGKKALRLGKERKNLASSITITEVSK